MNPKVLAGIKPNAGLEAQYQKRLDALVIEMHNSLVYCLTAAYKAKPPEMAQDASRYSGSPAMVMRRVMSRLTRRWTKRFDDMAPKLAEYFSRAQMDRTDRDLQRILKDGGIAIQWRMTAGANDVLQACIGQQTSLIKSIAQQHLTQVEGAVMRSVAAGGDLKALVDEIGPMVDLSKIKMGRRPGEDDKSLAARTRRRAAFIARDQVGKANADISRARMLSVGIRQAQWCHSRGGRDKRPSHVKASDEKLIYDVEKGALIDGEYIQPNQLPGCHCFYKPVLPLPTTQGQWANQRVRSESEAATA